ncbi:MAG: methionyl-tRNA formyltransferase [Stomatobaculum sp.]|nr:methionyl-tRNA formyltransferase [Stomatobaculum sp.]
MKIIYMGTPDFAVGPLKALIGAGHDVVCVLTRADKPKGRGHAVQFSPVKEAALEAGIPVLQPVRMKDPELWKTLEDYGADLFVVAAYGRILPKEILSIPKYGCVNIHASLLPDYRGAAPIQWAVIDGRKESGVTTMLMNEGLDTGDILRQYRITLADNETGGSLFDRLAALGSEAILDTVKGLEDGSIVPVKQEETTTPYAAMLTKEMGLADWSKDAETLERLIRGLDPWPGVYSYLDGKMLKLWKAEILPEGGSDAAPGTILSVKNGLAVQTGKGALRITELQPEGKKRMAADAWLRGARVSPGDCFRNER